MDVAGKKAIVFGGTSGIGLATSRRLAALGAEVLAVSRNPDRAGDVGERISLTACDVTDGDAVAALTEQHGPYDILVSAATGGTRYFQSWFRDPAGPCGSGFNLSNAMEVTFY